MERYLPDSGDVISDWTGKKSDTYKLRHSGVGRNLLMTELDLGMDSGHAGMTIEQITLAAATGVNR